MKTKMTINPKNTEKDGLLQVAIKQGYVSQKCNLAGGLIMALVSEGQNPCDECNADRKICLGSPKK
ncbi:MAG: hypothetical protein WC549_04610 [Actinomycetota bacterium]